MYIFNSDHTAHKWTFLDNHQAGCRRRRLNLATGYGSLSTRPFVFDIAIFVLKRDIKLQLTNCCYSWCQRSQKVHRFQSKNWLIGPSWHVCCVDERFHRRTFLLSISKCPTCTRWLCRLYSQCLVTLLLLSRYMIWQELASENRHKVE